MTRELDVEDGVRLVPLVPGQEEEVQSVVEANRAWLSAWLSWARDQRLEDSRTFLEKCAAAERAGGPPTWGIRLDGRLVGTLGTHGIDRENGVAEIGYWLARSYTGNGLMTRCVARVVDHCFAGLGLHRVEIRAAPGNLPSRRVAERLGFAYEGTQREARRYHDRWLDMCLYSMLAHEWEARRPVGGATNPNLVREGAR